MAFDLNKNDGSAKDSSNKTPGSSKFDLTKAEAAETTFPRNSSSSKTWIIALAGILIIGGGIWYYSTRSANVGEPALGSAEGPVNLSSSSQSKTAASTVEKGAVTVQPETTPHGADAVALQLNNKIPATFGQGSARISYIDQSLIKEITSYVSKNPAASIQVNGYASSDGPIEVNQAISQARANAFKQYLVSKSIPENKIVATGKGIENPIASNDTNSGRKKNRRVEVQLKYRAYNLS